MNEQTVKGAWREIKGEIQQMWGKLTGEELDRAEGNMGSVAGMIQQKYGHAKVSDSYYYAVPFGCCHWWHEWYTLPVHSK